MKKRTQIQNGIQIQENNAKIGKQETSAGSVILSFLCLWMASFGIFYGVAATFRAPVEWLEYWLLSFLICLFWVGVLQIKRWFGIAFVLVLIVYLYVFYQTWDNTLGGFCQIYNAILTQINEYYQLQLGMIPISHSVSADVFWALGILSFLPSGILAVGTMKKMRPMLIVVLEALPIVLALLLGLVVPLLPSMAMAFALLGSVWLAGLTKKKKNGFFLCASSEREKKTMHQTSLLFIIVFAVASSLAMPLGSHMLEPNLRKLDSIRTDIQNSTMEDLWIEWTEALTKEWEWLFPGNFMQSGGISGGKMGRIAAWNNTNIVHLRVYSREAEGGRLYLKAYVGSYYEENEWKTLEDYPDLPGLEIQSMGWNVLKELPYGAVQSRITVDNVRASSLYSYVPYYSNVTEFQQEVMDAAIQKQGRRSRTYSTQLFDMEEMLSLSGDVLKQWQDWYDEYEDWVYRQYLQLPEQGIEQIIEDYQTSFPYSANSYTVEQVRAILNRHAVYSTNPGVTPSGEDFNEYFLYEQKKGLCMHFASAATILFRIFGVPARYVEGYIVPNLRAGQINEVLDSHAHAWVEIWKDGLGWIPVEVTPGYEGDTQIVPAQQAVIETEEETQEETMQETAAETETSTEPEQSSVSNEQEETVQPTSGKEAIIWMAVAGLAAVGMVFVVIRKWRCQKMRQVFVGEKRPAIAAIASAVKKIQQISGQTWTSCGMDESDQIWLEQLALKARFSEHPIDRQEVQRAADLYWSLAEHCWEKSSRWVKVKIKWIYCLK